MGSGDESPAGAGGVEPHGFLFNQKVSLKLSTVGIYIYAV